MPVVRGRLPIICSCLPHGRRATDEWEVIEERPTGVRPPNAELAEPGKRSGFNAEFRAELGHAHRRRLYRHRAESNVAVQGNHKCILKSMNAPAN